MKGSEKKIGNYYEDILYILTGEMEQNETKYSGIYLFSY